MKSAQRRLFAAIAVAALAATLVASAWAATIV
jgi:hypothetical protein